jgi:hypothetical protein
LLSNARQRLSLLQGSRATLRGQLAAAEAQLAAIDTETRVGAEALRVVEELAQGTRQTTGQSVSALCTSAMRDVFGDTAGCSLRWVPVGSRGEYQPQFLSWDRDGVAQDPLDGNGNSAACIIALALRVWFLVRMGGPRLLWLDEPLAGVSIENQPRAVSWLRQLAEDLDIQIVLVSHTDPEVMRASSNQVLEVTRQGLVSEVRLVEN